MNRFPKRKKDAKREERPPAAKQTLSEPTQTGITIGRRVMYVNAITFR
jgi:hypothetical protein